GLYELLLQAPRWTWVVGPPLGALLAALIVRFSPESGGHGVVEVIEAVHKRDAAIRGRGAGWKALAAGPGRGPRGGARPGRTGGAPRRRGGLVPLAPARAAAPRGLDPARRRRRRGDRRLLPGAAGRIALRPGDRPRRLRRAPLRPGGARLRHGRRHLAG